MWAGCPSHEELCGLVVVHVRGFVGCVCICVCNYVHIERYLDMYVLLR